MVILKNQNNECDGENERGLDFKWLNWTVNWTEEEMDGKYKGMTRNVTKNEKLTELDKAILLTIYTRGGKVRKRIFLLNLSAEDFLLICMEK